MKVFATRVWGFTPDTWPIASFSSDGICRNLLAQSQAGDLLAFVGTKGPPTLEHWQGKIIGYCMFGRDVVDTKSIIAPEEMRGEALNKKGEIRWPRGMVMARAWSVTADPLPDLVETIGRQLPRMATTYAVPLTEDEASAVLSLPVEEMRLSGTARFEELRLKAERLSGRSFGPAPTDGARNAVPPREGASAWCYCFRFGHSNCFKIGWAYDLTKRLEEIRKHVPDEVIGQNWQQYLRQEWPNADAAYDMEQRVLDALPQDKISGERVVINATDMDVIWAKAQVT